ncbi:MAG TPA: hypothetical protein VGU02_12290 [Gaiellaceae bacterium]|nr:hypothetical protein [Gaiellaceae bacterium]
MHRNRVTPLGDIVAIPLRGAWTGNRGCVHRGADIVRFHATDLWIICELEFRGWHSELFRPGRFTWLFFHDEAVAFAAGHRPCALCRRASYNAYRDALGGLSASEINKQLHGERIVRGTHTRRLHGVPWSELPDGAFVLDDTPKLVLGDALVEWTTAGYGEREPRPVRGDAQAITPPSTLEVLRAGYPVQIATA